MVTVIFMKIETVIVVVFLAMYLAPSVSPSHGQTAGEILKVYEPLKRLERKTKLMEGAKKGGFSSSTAPWASMLLARCWKNFVKLTRIFRSAIIARAQPASITGWLTKQEQENTKSI